MGAFWVSSALAVVYFGNLNDVREVDAVVVLGAAQYDGKPSPVLKSRLNHAIELWKSGYAPLLILTGGAGVGDTTTEAEVGRKYAIAHGVPAAAIMIEKEGRTSSESLRSAAAILKERQLSSVILVSDPFHMFRLKVLARRFGMESHTSPTKSSPISANPSQAWRYVLLESLKAPLAFIMEKS